MSRRKRTDMITVFQLFNEDLEADCLGLIKKSPVFCTRRNSRKLTLGNFKQDAIKYFFSNRVVQHWNSLSDSIVLARNVQEFKNRLDDEWASTMYEWNIN